MSFCATVAIWATCDVSCCAGDAGAYDSNGYLDRTHGEYINYLPSTRRLVVMRRNQEEQLEQERAERRVMDIDGEAAQRLKKVRGCGVRLSGFAEGNTYRSARFFTAAFAFGERLAGRHAHAREECQGRQSRQKNRQQGHCDCHCRLRLQRRGRGQWQGCSETPGCF